MKLPLIKRRKLLEKLANTPTKQMVGRREKKVLNLREPSIDEFDDLIEGMISEAIAEYGKKIDELDNMVERWQTSGIALADFRLFKPYIGTICEFIAKISDDEEVTGEWVRENITPAQFIGCINKILELLDIGELYQNFYGALAMFNKAAGKKKR